MNHIVNLLHLCETMLTKWMTEEETKVPLDVLKKFAERNHLVLIKRNFNGTYKYKIIRKEIHTCYISGEEEKVFNFLDIADLHIGNKYFDESLLRQVFERAVKEGVNQVFIAGDVIEGFDFSEEANARYLHAIETAIDIFKDYPLNYFVICGNHDYSYEQIGLPNPLKRVSAVLQKKDVSFNYFDEYLVDFIICGIGKRMMHVERQDYTQKRLFQIMKLQAFDRKGFLNPRYLDQEYPLRFFQVGHIHENFQIYYPNKRIYISQPGSFLSKDDMDGRANFIKGHIENSHVYLD